MVAPLLAVLVFADRELLFQAFLFLLILYVGPDHLGIQPNCVNAITLGPKVIPPIWLLPELMELLKQLD